MINIYVNNIYIIIRFEKSKHYMSNEIQKLERDLESAKGELIKVQNQNQDKDIVSLNVSI